MTTKILTAALAFFTTFGFSSLLMQFAFDKPVSQTGVRWLYSKPTNEQVLRFLERDIQYGQQRAIGLTHPSLEEYRENVSIYINKSGGMDDSHLPADFQIAWRKHMQAWRDYSDFLNQLESFSEDKISKREIRRLHKEKDARITETWFEVLNIAGENYGAYPANAY